MSKYVYKVLEEIVTEDLEDVINQHAKKGWELVFVLETLRTPTWIVILKGKK